MAGPEPIPLLPCKLSSWSREACSEETTLSASPATCGSAGWVGIGGCISLRFGSSGSSFSLLLCWFIAGLLVGKFWQNSRTREAPENIRAQSEDQHPPAPACPARCAEGRL